MNRYIPLKPSKPNRVFMSMCMLIDMLHYIIIITYFVTRWLLQHVFLKLREGETIEIFNKTESEE